MIRSSASLFVVAGVSSFAPLYRNSTKPLSALCAKSYKVTARDSSFSTYAANICQRYYQSIGVSKANTFTQRRFFGFQYTCKRLQQRAGASDHYTTLGVSPTASTEEIKAAYKRLALQYHPDRNTSPGAEDTFKGLSEAYSIIGNKEKKEEYDAMRRGMGDRPSPGYGTYSSSRGAAATPPQGQYHQARQMSREEAETLFYEIFKGAGMNFEQMTRDMERDFAKSRGGVYGMRGMGPMGFPGGVGPAGFREGVTMSKTRIVYDNNGNVSTHRIVRDSNGNIYNIYNDESSNPDASMNQTPEEVNEKYKKKGTNRFQFGIGSSRADDANPGDNNFFTSSERINKQYDENSYNSSQFPGHNTFSRFMHFQSSPRFTNPALQLVYTTLWVSLILTIFINLVIWIFTNPILLILVLTLFFLRRFFLR
eukprot:Tbor_TRINITY_DN5784_c1_g1::TRINITY_DN5784_c1_g1_i2::g.19783::m.19783